MFLGDIPMAKQQDTTLPVLAHILGLITGFLGPLIILLAADDEVSKNNARAALNWQLSIIIYVVVAMLLMLTIVLIPLSILIFIALGIMNLVFCIIGAVRAGNGELYAYPLTIPFWKVK